MKLVRNIVFITIAAVLVSSALLYAVADGIIPVVKKPDQSLLEGRPYTQLADFETTSFTEGTFQTTFEQFAADGVPLRDSLILLGAGAQRGAISLAAVSLGYSFFPTYYGSDYVECPSDQVILKRVMSQPEKLKRLNKLIKTINKAAKAHKKTRFVVVSPLRPNMMDVNPTYRKMKQFKAMDPKWVQENFLDKLNDSIATRLDKCKTYKKLCTDWYSNDLHWTLKHALGSYNWIAKQLDLKKAKWREEDAFVAVPSWYGTSSRFGRDLAFDSTLVDMPDDFSNLTYYKLDADGNDTGVVFTPGTRETVLEQGPSQDTRTVYDAYTHYYGTSTDAIVQNSGKNNGKTCLFVCDSFGYCLTRYIANNYKSTVIIYPGNNCLTQPLEWYISTYKPNDVIVMLNGEKYKDIATNSPAFVGLE